MNHDNPYSQSLDRLSDYSDESLFVELRRVCQIVGRENLSIEDIDLHGRCSYAVIKKRFGGLRAALIAAGLKVDEYRRNPTRDELLRDLARVWDAVLTHEGRRPYKTDLKKFGAPFSSNTYERHFGSWIRACEALLAWNDSAGDVVETAYGTPKSIRSTEPKVLRSKRPIPLRIRYAILMRDRFTCTNCGRSPSQNSGTELHIDHIIPESQGGTLDPTNLRCLCQECNLGKGALTESVAWSG